MDNAASNDDEGGASDANVEENRRSTLTIDYAFANSRVENNVGRMGVGESLDDDAKDEEPAFLLGEDAKNEESRSRASILSHSIPMETLTQRSLSRDTFSFLIYTRRWSRPSLLAALVFCLQTSIFCLVLVDVIDPSNTGNPFNFPLNVESTVRATEVLAIAVAIITQDDVRKAINLLRDGYDEGVFRGTFGRDVSRSKWILSIVLRGCEGLLGLFVTFMLIMQSESVLDLLLNFSAMEFVSLIDDVAFSLTTEGFFGNLMNMEAKALSVMKYHVAARDTWKSSLLTATYFAVLFAVMITCWGIIFANQSSGKYLCGQFFLQLNDALVPSLGMLSGVYTVNRHVTKNGRVTAYQSWSGGMVGYCKDEEMWTVVIRKDGVEPDLCKDWVAALFESTDFDLTATASSSQWYARTKSGRVLPIDHTYIECYDCKDEENFCGESSSHGTCTEFNECTCAEGRYGLRCEFEKPCSVLEVDPRSEGFVGNRAFASKYYLAPGYERYDRPVFTSDLGENSYRPVGDVDIISFIGRRWVVTSGGMPIFPEDETVVNKEPSFISEAIDIDGRVDLAACPLGLEWYPALAASDHQVQGPDLSHSVDATLICAVCDNQTNPCLYNGTCGPNGSCVCAHGTTGVMCQLTPISNGRCDPYFNNADFEYDGGDCCESSCVSTDEFTCGNDRFVDIGYSQCNATETGQWISSGNPVYGVNSAARSGSSVALGGNGGTVLAVGDPGASVVRLFDKDGSNWVQRGQALQGPQNSDFGFAISLSGESENVRTNAFSSPVMTLTVGAPSAGLVRVYQCQTNGCVQVGSDITRDGDIKFGVSVSLSKDGMMVAIGGMAAGYDVVVYKRSDSETDSGWEQRGNPISGQRKLAISFYPLFGYYISLAGNGEGIAIGAIEVVECSGTAAEFSSADLVVQMYTWDEIREGWLIVGDQISKPHYLYDTPRSTWPLRPIVLSHDARVLAMGSSRAVEVYSWDGFSWAPREVDLNITESMGLVGWSVDLSADGSILAIGTSIESQNANSESTIRVHKWNGTHYSPFLNGLPAGETSAVSLSRDGKALAVGLPFTRMKGGSTAVYKFQPSSECDVNFQLLRISFTTDGNPSESRWTLHIDSNITVESQSYDDFPFTTFVEEICVSKDSCIKFRAFDSTGNGLDPPGVYSLMLDGKEITRGREFKLGEIKHFGNCDCPEGASQLSIIAAKNSRPMEWALSYPNKTLTGEHIFHGTMDNTVEIFEECIPQGCWYLTNPQCDDEKGCLIGLDWFYNVTYNGTSQTDSGGCEFCPIIALGECTSH